MSRTAVVILNWNGLKYLQYFLHITVRNTTGDGSEIIIADNHSTDGSVEYIEKHYPGIRLIRFDRNYGFAMGYRKALEQIDADYYVLLNSDIEVTECWLEPLIGAMEGDPAMAACMPVIRSYNRRDMFEYAGAAGGFIDRYGYPFCRGRIMDNIECDEGQYDDTREVFWASGACMVLRAECYRRAGGLDDMFFAHMEEIDLCWRLQRMGYTIRCITASTVFHVGGGTLPNDNPRKLYLNYRNNIFLLVKNLAFHRLFTVLPVRIMMDIASSFVYLGRGSGGLWWAVVRAHASVCRQLPALLRARCRAGRLCRSFRIGGIYRRSIVYDYFVRKIRVFGQLEARCFR